MRYDFKRLEELAWFGFVAAGLVILEALARFPDPVGTVLDDWRTWLIGLAGAALRAGAAVVLAAATKPK